MHARHKITSAFTIGLVAVAASIGSFAATAAPAPAGANVVRSVGRLGVKLINPGAIPAANHTMSVHSKASTGVVSPQPAVYLVFWGSQWSHDPAGAAPALQNFFGGLFGAADTWGTILNQYCEGVPVGTKTCGTAGIHIQHPSVSPLAGVWFDSGHKAPRAATGNQIASEAVAAADHFGNTSQAANLNAQYVIASPTNTKPDGFPRQLCGYHSATSSPDGTVAYTNLPYVPDLGAGGCTTISHPTILDGYFSTESHEYGEVLTDFFIPKGWYHTNTAGEIGDLCTAFDARETLSTGTFDVQGLWSNSANACRTSG